MSEGRPVKPHRSGSTTPPGTKHPVAAHSTAAYQAGVENDFISDSKDFAYDRGRDAYFCSHMPSVNDNPYPAGSSQSAAWRSGFDDAHSDDAE